MKNHRSYDTSQVPAIGEVEERFNPKPYFVYGSASNQNLPVNNEPIKMPESTNYNSPVYLPTVLPTENLPAPQLPTTEPKPHEDPYTSPYSSYNPPPKSIEQDNSYYSSHSQMDNSHDDASFSGNQDDSEDDYLPQVENPKMKDSPDEDDIKNQSFDSYFPEPDDSHHESDHNIKPNRYKEVILDHPPPGYGEKEVAMVPPPSDQFPHYLYDEEHSDHHVYHEVEKPKEQKRVSKPQYSYYYIGRKLWYIPLYFSVYFIIYVTFLILKSIARHKIQFKHDLVDLHSRESRQLRDSISSENLNDVHRNVTDALERGKKMFPLVVM